MSPSPSAGNAPPGAPRRARLSASLAAHLIGATGVLALLVAAAFSLLLVAVLDLRGAAGREARSKDVTVAALALEKLVLDLETGVRGFVITGNPRLLRPWQEARASLGQRMQALQRLVAGHERQRRQARALAAAIRAYEEDYSLPLVRIARRSPAAARTPLAAAEGERRMDAIRRGFVRFLQEENARTAASAAAAREESSRALWVGIAALSASALLVLAFGLYLTRGIARPVREAAEVAARVAAGDLSRQLTEAGPGEVRALAASFNAMTRSLADSRAELEAHVAQQQAVAELSRRALAESDFAALLEEAVTSVADTLAVDYVALWERAPSGEGWLLRAGLGWPVPDLEIGALAPTTAGGEDDEAALPALSQLAPWGVSAGLTLPVPEPGQPLAALGAYAARARSFTRDEELFLRAVASLLAAAAARRRLEESLRQAQKLEAVGRLAGGIAHDFNNILLAIKAEAWLLDAELPPDAEERRLVQAIDAAAERAGALVRRLLAFSRQQPWRQELLDPSAVVAAVADMVQPLIGEDVELILELDPDPGLVHMDRAQLEQVVMNLVVNAREAMPEGGRLTVATRRVETAEEREEGRAGYVAVEVTDTGVGIPREDQARIFEPFFTSKAEGSGLGLAIVHGIVARAGGRIEVRSAPGAGATFSVYLPRVGEPVTRMQAPARPAPPPRGSETILLVEDDAMVRQPVAAILEGHGYRVLPAATAAEALRATEEGEHPVDLLVTDVVMPDLSGPELAHVLQRIQPGLRVVYLSGYPERAAAFAGLADELASERAVFVHKPFAPETLLEAVRALLDRGRWSTPAEEPPAAGLPGLPR